MKIGIISDTHGIFREEWHRHLDGCDYLIHAGDFCTQKNYDCFRNFGIPLYMVRGNNDRGDWAKNLPEFLQFSSFLIWLVKAPFVIFKREASSFMLILSFSSKIFKISILTSEPSALKSSNPSFNEVMCNKEILSFQNL